MPFAVLVAAALASSTPEVRIYRGPLHYCGESFAIDLSADERIEMRDGPDFVAGALISPRLGFGIYEGRFPESRDGQRVDGGLGVPTTRKPKDEYGNFGYLIEPKPGIYVDLWGRAFKNTAEDYSLLRRLDFRDSLHRGCASGVTR